MDPTTKGFSFKINPLSLFLGNTFQASNYFCPVYSNVNLGYPFLSICLIFLDVKKLNSFLSVSKLVLDFTILHIVQTRVIILVKFIKISICDYSCLKV